MKLLFVYNADSGLLSSLKDTVHKAVSPNTYACNLCRVTYGVLSMKDEWRSYVETLPHDVEFLHRDEFRARFPGTANVVLPAMFLVENAMPSVMLNAKEIGAVKDIRELIAIVNTAIKSINTQGGKLYRCPVCGFHYRDEKMAKECEAWCREHKSCNIEIIAHAVENEKK